MNSQFHCTCGYTLISDDDSLTEVICPDCEIPLSPNGGTQIEKSESKPKFGLWQLMRERKTDSSGSLDILQKNINAEEKPPAYKSLWETMTFDPSSTPQQKKQRVEKKRETIASDSKRDNEVVHPPNLEDDIVKLDQTEKLDREISEPIYEKNADRRSIDSFKSKPVPRNVIVGSIISTIAVVVSPVGMLEHFLFKFPGTFIAFFGLMISLQAWNDLSRSRKRRKGIRLAGYGVVCGVLGMLLGPTVFSWWGNQIRDKSGNIETESHLEQIGIALNQYHSQNQKFPIGGIFQRAEGKPPAPMHGWMTALLPFMESHEQQVYRNINLDVPYDHPKNRQAMSTEILNFYAAGSSRNKLNGDFAVTHFAGVGGATVSKSDNIGIFQRDIAISKKEIKDGLSNTLAVGEIAYFFPAWGSPDNWRTIRSGLNKAPMGFGNASRTGAMFLHADGSAKFYPNATSTELLKKLSTRDGGEE